MTLHLPLVYRPAASAGGKTQDRIFPKKTKSNQAFRKNDRHATRVWAQNVGCNKKWAVLEILFFKKKIRTVIKFINPFCGILLKILKGDCKEGFLTAIRSIA